jgi:hypothetical protein
MLIKILLAFSSSPLCLAHGHAHPILDFTSASVYFFGVGWSVSVWLRPDQEYLGDYTTGNVLKECLINPFLKE